MADETATTETGHGPISERLLEVFEKLSKGRQDDYYLELGKITVAFGTINIGTRLLLGLISGKEPAGNKPLRQVLETLGKVIPSAVADGTNRENIIRLVGRIDDARKERNRLIHSIWYLIGRKNGLRYDHKTGEKHLVPLKELTDPHLSTSVVS